MRSRSAPSDPDDYVRRAKASMADHVRAMLAFQASGSVTFDYGNNIRAFAQEAGVENAFDFPGFVPAFIRPLFCEGKGPFRVAALSGDVADIARIDRALAELFPADEGLQRWLRLAAEKVPVQGLPARICWLGYGDRARAGAAINELVASGEVSAPIVIGRDHLDAGSVASPNRETEAMRDGSDAIADWPILNALVNTAAGATWVSFHHGGGVGIGYSLHAGMVVVADGTPEAAARLERVLTSDPGMGVLRHADAGYERALEVADERRRPHPDAARLTRPMRRPPHQPLPGAPDPWASSSMPPFRARPPYVMSEMIAAEPAVAERLVRRLAKDAALERVAAEIREAVDAGRPVMTTGCGTSEHAAMAIAMLLSEALDLPAGREVRSVQALETLPPPPRERAAAGRVARGRHARDPRGDARRAGRRCDDRAITVSAGSPGVALADHVDHHRGAGPELVPHRRLPGAARRRHGPGREAAPIAARRGRDPGPPRRQPGRARPGGDRGSPGRDGSDRRGRLGPDAITARELALKISEGPRLASERA